MRNLLRFIIRHHFFILFLLFELSSLTLLFSLNTYQKVAFHSFSQRVTGRFALRISNFMDYMSLRKENRELIQENTILYNRLSRISGNIPPALPGISANDTMAKFGYFPARVINNSTNRQHNYITLDKGKIHGLTSDMAVVSSNGVVGLTKSVSENFSVVLSMLNLDFMVSGKIKKNGYFGPVSWDGIRADRVILTDIPHHVELSVGDTIVTSGYGEVFPEGCLIGIIEDFRLKGGNYYEIDIRLSTDFRNLENVQVIKSFYKEELDSLENASIE